MADDTATLTFSNDTFTDASGNTATYSGNATVDYTTNSYTLSYSVIGSGLRANNSTSNSGGLVSNSDGSYTISDSNFTLTYSGKAPTSGAAQYVEDGFAFDPTTMQFTTEVVDTYATTNNANGQITQPIVSSEACYVSGTLIQTARDKVAVEALAVGDVIVTSSGDKKTIGWLGRRTVDCRNHPRPHNVMPVRISAHAFGANLPERDLFLSPGHPVLVGADDNGNGGHLVPIMCLINGTTIERVAVEEVTYWHVELDEHDILLAEGLPAESYIDLGSRPWFDGADGALSDPDMAAPGMPGRCRPVAIDGPVVEAERRRLDAVFATRLTTACAWPEAEISHAF